ncbi:MAG: hypothetical protein ONB46_16685 [candidate division KSB1 bacterium]|nr:hypothetical protein [candidate division KSB1 bacterium]MDZ7367372.1 hypothetical protein [candidate division KSB1 bacterium]
MEMIAERLCLQGKRRADPETGTGRTPNVESVSDDRALANPIPRVRRLRRGVGIAVGLRDGVLLHDQIVGVGKRMIAQIGLKSQRTQQKNPPITTLATRVGCESTYKLPVFFHNPDEPEPQKLLYLDFINRPD